MHVKNGEREQILFCCILLGFTSPILQNNTIDPVWASNKEIGSDRVGGLHRVFCISVCMCMCVYMCVYVHVFMCVWAQVWVLGEVGGDIPGGGVFDPRCLKKIGRGGVKNFKGTSFMYDP